MSQKQTAVTHDAVLASTLDKVIAICAGSPEEQEMGKISMKVVLEILTLNSINTREEEAQANLVCLMAKVIDDMELEAKMLEILKPYMKSDAFNALAKLDFSNKEKNEEFMYTFGNLFILILKEAGLEDLETSFAELDSLAQEVQA